jgi:hypothetical protein
VHKRFLEWEKAGFFEALWKAGLAEYEQMEASPGDGRASTEHSSRHPWHSKPSGPTRRIGEKNGGKRHLLVDGRGVPLSIIVTAANVNDGSESSRCSVQIVVEREPTPIRRSKHLCADAGYRSAEALRIIDVCVRQTHLDLERRAVNGSCPRSNRWTR